jgi:leucyl aminopeptidase
MALVEGGTTQVPAGRGRGHGPRRYRVGRPSGRYGAEVTTFALNADDATSLKADALVVGVASSGRSRKSVVLASDPKTAKKLATLAETLNALGATGAADEIVKVPAPRGVAAAVVVTVGLGERSGTYTGEQLRRAAGAASRALAGSRRAVFALPTSDAEDLEAVATGALLGSYSFTDFRAVSKSKQQSPLGGIVVAGTAPSDKPARAAIRRAQSLVQAVNLARDFVNTPPNALRPPAFADQAAEAATEAGVTAEILGEKQLKAGGYGGILAVGQGSEAGPRLLRLTYRPEGATKHLALVGKGITFDTGGISIKPALGMEAMKNDMGGAAAVIAATIAIARLGVPVNVTCYAAMAENMPSGAAQRPSDVFTAYGGRTVEVLNTDAEGRLVMCDALVRATEDEPDAIIDVATLTGAQTVALGSRTAGIMANDDDLRADVHAAADAVGEAMWPMPLPPELRKGLDSQVADIANIDKSRMAGMLSAGTFLKEFVEGFRWAHLDIAGPAFELGQPWGYTPRGGTGFAVRTLVQVAEDMSGTA